MAIGAVDGHGHFRDIRVSVFFPAKLGNADQVIILIQADRNHPSPIEAFNIPVDIFVGHGGEKAAIVIELLKTPEVSAYRRGFRCRQRFQS